MSEQRRERRTERGLDRLVAFSDGVVAIAITLLVLPLLDVADDVSSSDVWSDAWPRMQGFAITFAVVASFWVVHHRLFELIDGYNGRLVWANMLWLATIAFLPFSSEVVGTGDLDDMTVRALYIGSLVACSVALAVIDVAILRSPDTWPDGERPDIDVTAVVVRLGVMAAAFVIGTFVAPIGLWALLLLFLARPITGWIERGRSEPATT
ncbi:MAG TPA: TMEM175 family protein [Microthrixaceae bacterium]|nr:TMEM175 family protein [Microthrixaceae bacterium]